MKPISYILILFQYLFLQTTQATTWITINNGSWSDSSIWLSGIVPSYSITDTVIIKDTVYFHEDIYLNSGALIQIDTFGGALCGHENITIYTGARLNVIGGTISIDTLFIKGGNGYFALSGSFLMWHATITEGGSMQIHPNAFGCVCLWDTCFIRSPSEPLPEDSTTINQYILFPNPSSGNFNLQYSQESESTFYFYNVLGQIIFSTTLEGTSGSKSYNVDDLNNGLYFWEIRSGDKIYKKGKHIIIK